MRTWRGSTGAGCGVQVHWAPRIQEVTVKSVKVRALHDGQRVAILLEYAEPPFPRGHGERDRGLGIHLRISAGRSVREGIYSLQEHL